MSPGKADGSMMAAEALTGFNEARAVSPGKATGLKQDSQVMVDKTIAIPRAKITARIGSLRGAHLEQVEAALRLWLALD